MIIVVSLSTLFSSLRNNLRRSGSEPYDFDQEEGPLKNASFANNCMLQNIYPNHNNNIIMHVRKKVFLVRNRFIYPYYSN